MPRPGISPLLPISAAALIRDIGLGSGLALAQAGCGSVRSVAGHETANFSIVRAVPEPETYALMMAGLAALGFISRRRKSV